MGEGRHMGYGWDEKGIVNREPFKTGLSHNNMARVQVYSGLLTINQLIGVWGGLMILLVFWWTYCNIIKGPQWRFLYMRTSFNMDENIIFVFTYTKLYINILAINLYCLLPLPQQPKACLNSPELL